jgi:hypothetical protein
MIKTRIASTAALATFGLAAIGGTALTIAAPANAAPSASGVTSSSRTSHRSEPANPELFPTSSLRTSHRFEPAKHALFPGVPLPHSDHYGQGHKGFNEITAPVLGIRDPFPAVTATSDADDSVASSASNKSRPKKHELFPVQHGDV